MTATNDADDPEPVRLDPVDVEVDARDTPDEAPTREMRWAYGGVRVLGGKKVHALVEDAGHGVARLYSLRAAGLVIGEIYRVTISYERGHTCLHGQPRYHGDGRVKAELAAQWRAQHEAAQAALALARQHRHAARRDELDDALEPLRVIAATLRTSADRTAFAAYVLTEITSAWTRPRPSTKD
jgi:hypothetical protein